MRRVLPILLVAALRLTAQQVGENSPITANQPTTFKTGAQLVVETVSVTDKQGRPVEGLNAKGFTVTENGVPQSIRFFEQQKLPESPPAPLAPSRLKTFISTTNWAGPRSRSSTPAAPVTKTAACSLFTST